MSTKLKRYLDSLANGPMLDPVTKPGPFLKGVGFMALGGDEAALTPELVKRRKAIKERHQRAKPLVVPKRRRHKS